MKGLDLSYSKGLDVYALKRNLNTCGADFFIDNYSEIKRHSFGNISRDKTIEIIGGKDKWKNIKTIGNRISTVKSIFLNSKNIDALKICIKKRIPDSYIQEAKYILFKETGTSLDIPIINKKTSFYWLNANLNIWNIDEFKTGETQSYTTYNENGNKRRIYQDMLNLKMGDLIIGYQGKPDACIKALFQVVENFRPNENNLKESFKFKKIATSETRVSWDNLLNSTGIRKTGLVQNSNSGPIPFTGSLHKITKELYDEISIISKFNFDIDYLYFQDSNQTSENQKSENQKIKIKKMEYPLNKIFFGPPGTGKTYKISSEVEKIINSSKKNNKSASTREEKFNRICESIRNIGNLEIKANSLYRNERAILKMLGYLLEPPFNDKNSITRGEAIENGLDPSPSSWSQWSQYITQFGFVDDWRKSTEIILNERGIKLKESIMNFLIETNQSYKDLKNWNQDPPEIIKELYFSAISEMERDDFTVQMKAIYCIINLALNNSLRSESEYQKRELTDREEALIYIDIEDDNADIKWIGQIGRSLRGLGILDNYQENDEGKKTYSLSKTGIKLVDTIIENWELNYTELFGDFLSYEDAIKHGRAKFITFHQSYSYEEFIEGIRPKIDSDELKYSIEKGIFKEISDNAKNYPNNNYVIIIDEINRGNISKIFGELITLIESKKRLFTDNGEQPNHVTLPYSKKSFGVPKNLFILGTMNTADKSIALIDSALRRRFVFEEMLPNSEVLIKENIDIKGVDIKLLFEKINARIEYLIDKDKTIGHSYFLKLKGSKSLKNLALLFKNEIIPLLMEYFYNDYDKVRLVLGDNNEWKPKDKNKFFEKISESQKNLFGDDEAIDGYEDKVLFKISNLFDTDERGQIIASDNDLINLFKSVYTKED